MQEVESILYSHFKTTANTIAQFYMGSVQLQRKSYAEGVKNTVEKINHFLLTHSASSSSNTASSSIQVNALVNFLDKLVEDVNNGLIEDKGKTVTSPGINIATPAKQFDANVNNNAVPVRTPTMSVNTASRVNTTQQNSAGNNWASAEPPKQKNSEQRTYFSFSPPNNSNNANSFFSDSPALHSMNNTTTAPASATPVTFDFSQNFANDKASNNMFMFTSPSSPFNSGAQQPQQQSSKKVRKPSSASNNNNNATSRNASDSFSSPLGQQQQTTSQPNPSSRASNSFTNNNNSECDATDNALKRVFGDVFMMEDCGSLEIDFGEASPLHSRVKRQRIVGLQ